MKAVEKNLADLHKWLGDCGYLDSVIEHGIYTAIYRAQPQKKTDKVIPLISTYYSNYSNKYFCTLAKRLVKSTTYDHIANTFQEFQFVQALVHQIFLERFLIHVWRTEREDKSLQMQGRKMQNLSIAPTRGFQVCQV